jgi:predicted ATPase
MYVSNLKIQNVRNFPDLSIQLSKRMNLIIGPNSAGKSTIIRSLYQLQNRNSITGSDVRLGTGFARIQIALEDISPDDTLKHFSATNPLEKEASRCRVEFTIGKKETDSIYFQDPPSQQGKERDFHGLPMAENEQNFIYPLLSKRKVFNYAVSSSTQNANAVMDTFQNLALKVLKAVSQPRTKAAYENSCKGVLGHLITPITTESGNLSLGAYANNEAMIPIESMGDGVPNIVGLITSLVSENGKLFLMEEPENDLHPAAMKKLLQLIEEKSYQNQFIISTHSNIVLKHLAVLPDSRIFYANAPVIDESNRYVPSSEITPVGNSPADRLSVLEQLGYSPFDFEIYKGYIILEESSAERLIRDFIVPLFLPQAAGIIRFIAAQGTSDLLPKLRHLEEIFLYLHLSPLYARRAWIIADGDTAGHTSVDSIKSKYKSWDAAHFLNWEKPQFEDYYPTQFKDRADQIRSLPNSPNKQNEKKHLLNDVIDWLNQNPDKAKLSLEESATEIINVLSSILTKLQQE